MMTNSQLAERRRAAYQLAEDHQGHLMRPFKPDGRLLQSTCERCDALALIDTVDGMQQGRAFRFRCTKGD